MSHEALKRALAKADDNQSAFAAAVGTSQQRISYLLKNGKSMPAELVLKTEEVYGIPRHELRPDIYPEPLEKVA
jgi:DNA-binding transcriptional regulator YdaS (Cro superfamily)